MMERAVRHTPSRVDGVLLDVDGVLLDSSALLRQVWLAWARMRNLDPDLVLAHCHGRRPEDTIRAVAADLDPLVERRILDQHWRAVVDQVTSLPGARELLVHLAGRSVAIVTSSSRWSVEQSFAANRLPMPPVQVFGEDVTAGKPSPAGYQLAIAALGVPAASCVVVEDSPAGVVAGLAAGCHVVAVTTTHTASDLRDAHVCVPSLREVLDLLNAAP